MNIENKATATIDFDDGFTLKITTDEANLPDAIETLRKVVEARNEKREGTGGTVDIQPGTDRPLDEAMHILHDEGRDGLVWYDERTGALRASCLHEGLYAFRGLHCDYRGFHFTRHMQAFDPDELMDDPIIIKRVKAGSFRDLLDRINELSETVKEARYLAKSNKAQVLNRQITDTGVRVRGVKEAFEIKG